MGFAQEFFLDFIGTEARCCDVNPHEVGAFEFEYFKLWQMLVEECEQSLIVAPKILVKFVNPLGSLVIGRFECYRSEGVDVADFIDIDGAVDATTCFRVSTDDVGDLEAGGVE